MSEKTFLIIITTLEALNRRLLAIHGHAVALSHTTIEALAFSHELEALAIATNDLKASLQLRWSQSTELKQIPEWQAVAAKILSGLVSVTTGLERNIVVLASLDGNSPDRRLSWSIVDSRIVEYVLDMRDYEQMLGQLQETFTDLQRVVLNLQTVLEKYNETMVQERTRGCLISITSFYPELARELGAREIFPTHKFPPVVQPIVSKKWEVTWVTHASGWCWEGTMEVRKHSSIATIIYTPRGLQSREMHWLMGNRPRAKLSVPTYPYKHSGLMIITNVRLKADRSLPTSPKVLLHPDSIHEKRDIAKGICGLDNVLPKTAEDLVLEEEHPNWGEIFYLSGCVVLFCWGVREAHTAWW